MSCSKRPLEDQDPDYQDGSSHESKRQRIIEEKARSDVCEKVRRVVRSQFSVELRRREEELLTCQQRLHQAQQSLQLLRYVAVASYYAEKSQATTDVQTRIHPAVKKLVGKQPPESITELLYPNSVSRKLTAASTPSTYSINYQASTSDHPQQSLSRISASTSNKHQSPPTTPPKHSTISNTTTPQQVSLLKQPRYIPPKEKEAPFVSPSRATVYKSKKRLVVGNISKWLPEDSREDAATHKWMLYVRGPREAPDISSFVERVRFFLHPSYQPNDVIEVTCSPFHLARRGWGEFPVRVQMHFHNALNRPVDIIHHLKLDRTYTGLQTLGAETVVDMWLYDKNSPTNTKHSSSPLSNHLNKEECLASHDDVEKLFQPRSLSSMDQPSTSQCFESDLLSEDFCVGEEYLLPVKAGVSNKISSTSDVRRSVWQFISAGAEEDDLSSGKSSPSLVTHGHLDLNSTRSVPFDANLPEDLFAASSSKDSSISSLNGPSQCEIYPSNIKLEETLPPSYLLKVESKPSIANGPLPSSFPQSSNKIESNSLLIKSSSTQQGIANGSKSLLTNTERISLLNKSVDSLKYCNGIKIEDTLEDDLPEAEVPHHSLMQPSCTKTKDFIPSDSNKNVATLQSTLEKMPSLTLIKASVPLSNDLSEMTQRSLQQHDYAKPNQENLACKINETKTMKMVNGTSTVSPLLNKNCSKLLLNNGIKKPTESTSGSDKKVTLIKCLDKSGRVLYVSVGNKGKEAIPVTGPKHASPTSLQKPQPMLPRELQKSTPALLPPPPPLLISKPSKALTTALNTQKGSNNILLLKNGQLYLLQSPTTSATPTSNALVKKSSPQSLLINKQPSTVAVQKSNTLIPSLQKPSSSGTSDGSQSKTPLSHSEALALMISTTSYYEKALKRLEIPRVKDPILAMARLLRALPLVTPLSKVIGYHRLHPYAAPSHHTFLSWNIGKRKAAEHMRSREVRRLLLAQGLSVWDAWEIARWARKHGFTPLHPSSDTASSPSSLVPVSSYSEPLAVMEWLTSQPAGHMDEPDVEVDIEGLGPQQQPLPSAPVKRFKPMNKHGLDLLDPNLASECLHVRDTAAQLGVHLSEEEIIPGMMLCASERLVLEATKLLAEDLIRRSLAQAWSRNSGRQPASIQLSDVRSALLHRPEFDLFTNSELGVQPSDSS